MRSVCIRKNGRVLWRAGVAESFFDRIRGLMSRPEVIPLLFVFEREGRRRNSIHSLFCKPFDAIFINSRRQIVSVMKNIRPFRLFITPAKKAKFLLELPRGESRKIRVGDTLEW